MGFVRFLVWTSMCIGLGIFVASWEVDGKTPMQHMKTIWKGAPSVSLPVEKLKEAKQKLTAPTETHSDEDREAINRIVAKRK